jgi:hypothetical protein
MSPVERLCARMNRKQRASEASTIRGLGFLIWINLHLEVQVRDA